MSASEWVSECVHAWGRCRDGEYYHGQKQTEPGGTRYAKCRMLNVEELSLHRNHPYSCNGKGTYSEIKVWHLRTLNKLLAFNKHVGVGAGSVPPLHYTIRCN